MKRSEPPQSPWPWLIRDHVTWPWLCACWRRLGWQSRMAVSDGSARLGGDCAVWAAENGGKGTVYLRGAMRTWFEVFVLVVSAISGNGARREACERGESRRAECGRSHAEGAT